MDLHTVNFKTHRKSYKQKKKIENDKSEWIIFENTHEPIIDKSTFEIVQKIRENLKCLTKMGEMPMFYDGRHKKPSVTFLCCLF